MHRSTSKTLAVLAIVCGALLGTGATASAAPQDVYPDPHVRAYTEYDGSAVFVSGADNLGGIIVDDDRSAAYFPCQLVNIGYQAYRTPGTSCNLGPNPQATIIVRDTAGAPVSTLHIG